MADNTTLDAGSGGDVIASDDITGVKYQRVKLVEGADGTNDGDIAAGNPLPVEIIDVDGTTAADIGSIKTAVEILDNAISGSEMQVDIVSGTVDLGATDNAVLDTIAGDTTSLDGKVPTIPTGAGTEAAAVRVTLATDSTGVVSVDDGGGALTVDGTVTANLGATDNAVLDDIAAQNTTVAGAVSGSEMQVDVVAALPAGTNLIGDVGLSGARTSGGTTPYRNIDVDESEDQVKGSGGQIYWLHAMNLSSGVIYLHLYNALAASVTVGTTTPDHTFPLATQGDTNGAGFTLSIPNGIAFGTGITVAATTTIGGADAPGANEVILNMGYA